MAKKFLVDVIMTTRYNIKHINIVAERDVIILIINGNTPVTYHTYDRQESLEVIDDLRSCNDVSDLIFLSRKDSYNNVILPELENLLNLAYTPIILFVPYKKPPLYGQREDGKVESFIIKANIFDKAIAEKAKNVFWKIIYRITYKYLNSNHDNNILIKQLGKISDTLRVLPNLKLLENSLLIIPHKGSVKLLNRCLNHLNLTTHLPENINICFDDHSYKQIDIHNFACLQKAKLFVNEPLNSGPYPSRHYSIMNSDKEYIFFQDSDDVSAHLRFETQANELENRGLDMIGSHELRVDQYSKSLKLFRYPLDANKSLDARNYHSLFHPTALITKKAYIKAQGFSTDRRFGYDSQFLMRAHFFLKIGNIDDFLYIRFKRPNSLTTHPKTKIGSHLRSFLLWRWRIDFKLVSEKKLDLAASSLITQAHKFDYELKRIVI
jgi:hypothetical protein